MFSCLLTTVLLAAAVVSDVEVHRERMNGSGVPTLHYVNYDDGSVVLDNRDSCVRSIYGVHVAAGAQFRLAPPFDEATPVREEPLEASADEVARRGFAYEFEIDFTGVGGDERLLSVPGALDLYFRAVDGENRKGFRQFDSIVQNYVNFPLSDGSCVVLEALVPGPAGRIGIPLGLLKRPTGVKKVLLNHTTAHWQIYVEDVLDEDLPFGELVWPQRGAVARVYSQRVKSARLSVPARPDVGRVRHGASKMRRIEKPIQFFTPPDHNAWVGDVTTGYHEGRFHVFYLFDRRHHRSKAGRGGHYFAHLSSADLVTWSEHAPAAAIDERWETHGTGTPFAWNGKYYLAYGLHTVRTVDWEKTTGPTMQAYRRKHGREGLFRMEDLAPLVPQGGTYAQSDDGGISFRKSNVLFTSAQNPTVYNRWDGKLGLADYTKLNWSDTFGDWKVWDDKIHTHGDCPCVFEWNGHHYIVQGFFTMSHSPSGLPGSYTSWEETGEDIYDGLSVPMVSPFAGGRRILAGWLSHPCGWGGWLCFRELVQYADGRLGMKWLAETPPPARPDEWRGLSPQKTFAVRYRASDGRQLELRVEPARSRAQFADVSSDRTALEQMTLQEKVLSLPADRRTVQVLNAMGAPNKAESFAIGKIRGLDRPFGVRCVAWYDPKSNVTVFDAEIASQRTMICRRTGRWELVRGEFARGTGDVL